MKQFFMSLMLCSFFIVQSGFSQKGVSVASPLEMQILKLPLHQKLVPLKAIYMNMNTRVAPPAEFPIDGTPTATIDVTYNGFTPQAQVAFQAAVDIWSAILVSSVPIKVEANWASLNPGVLGAAGPNDFFRNFSNAPLGNTWYPVALAEAISGTDLNSADSADIVASFNSDFSNWYLGTDGNTPSGQFDFVSVVLHELGHGLGFVGSMTVDSSGAGSWGFNTGSYFVYDHFAVNGSSQQLTNTGLFPNSSNALGSQLTGGDLFYAGANAATANGGTAPPLYAPNPWDAGSSFSHWDEASYPAGNPNSLMTPQIGQAEAIHSPGDITLGLLEDNGWGINNTGGNNIKYEETFASITIPAGWTTVDNDGNGTSWNFVQQLDFNGNLVNPEAGQSFWHSSFQSANGFLIDDWLISPQLPGPIENGDILRFYAGAFGGNFDDSLRVFISTTDANINSFTNQIAYFKANGPIGSFTEHSFDLTAFAGETIYVGVNYYIVNGGPNGADSENIWLDHFILEGFGAVGIEDENEPVQAATFILEQNYPNPFNPRTNIRYSLPVATPVKVTVFNTLGQRVATLVNDYQAAGNYTVNFDGRRLSSGIYFYQLETTGFNQVKKMLLAK